MGRVDGSFEDLGTRVADETNGEHPADYAKRPCQLIKQTGTCLSAYLYGLIVRVCVRFSRFYFSCSFFFFFQNRSNVSHFDSMPVHSTSKVTPSSKEYRYTGE